MLHVLGLGLLLLRSYSWQLEERKAPLLSSCALGRQVEQLLRCAELLVDNELFLHLDVADAIREHGDDGLVRHLGDLEANVVKALDVLVGERSNFKKKILRTRKIMVMHSNERGECVHVPS